MVLNYIYSFFKNNKMLFTIFMLLLISSVCAVFFITNFLSNIFIENSYLIEKDRTYIVSLDNVNTEQKMETLLLQNPEVSLVYCLINNEGEAIRADYYDKSSSNNITSFGKWFSEEDTLDGNHKVILPNYPYLFRNQNTEEYDIYEIGDSYFINDIPYEAIGIGTLIDFVYQIPYKSIPMNCELSFVAIVTDDFKSEVKIQHFSAYLENLFNGVIMESPIEIPKTSFWNNYSTETILIIGIVSMGIFNLVYIYTYILDTRRKEIAINRILGRTKLSSIVNYYLETFSLATIAFILSSLFFKYVILVQLKNLGFLFKDSLLFANYLVIYVGFIFIFSVVFLPIIILYITKSPSEVLSDV